MDKLRVEDFVFLGRSLSLFFGLGMLIPDPGIGLAYRVSKWLLGYDPYPTSLNLMSCHPGSSALPGAGWAEGLG